MTVKQKRIKRYNRRYYRRNRVRIIQDERNRRKKYEQKINRRRRILYIMNKQKILDRNKKWRNRNSEKTLMQKRLQRLREMGLSTYELNKATKAFHEHKGKCEICGVRKPGGMGGWIGDHCYKTKKFRGVLCNSCNAILGFAGDSIKTLRSAIAYLKKHQ